MGDYDFLQGHLLILSGLYGVLKPLNAIQPYRLEMGTRLANSAGKNLYSFWNSKVTKYLANALKKDKSPTVINLASKEYFSVIDTESLGYPIVSITFKEERSGKLKIIPIQAKRARGIMANWLVKNKIDTPDELLSFSEARYEFQKVMSSESEYVFCR